MSEWKEYKLGNLADITSSKRIFYSDYVTEGIPFFRSKEIEQIPLKNFALFLILTFFAQRWINCAKKCPREESSVVTKKQENLYFLLLTDTTEDPLQLEQEFTPKKK